MGNTIDWIESDPLPEACRVCQEADCYACDFSGDRWHLSEADELILQKKSILRAIGRLLHRLDEVEEKLKHCQ